jgi:putative NADH-flavin reductase
MRITIFGAGGQVGRLCVEQALTSGCQVVAFAHSEPNFDSNPYLKVLRGDVHNKEDVYKALEGSDLVLSALGSWGTPNKDILASAMRNIIPAMSANRITRIISLTGSAARVKGEPGGLMRNMSHSILSNMPIKGANKVIEDAEDHIRLLHLSGLDWTVIRAPVMNNRGDPDKYIIGPSRPKPWGTINRLSVALSMIELAKNNKEIGRCPYINRL